MPVFKNCVATIGKVIIFEGARKEAELIYLYDFVTKIETQNNPHQLVFNMDQTPSKYIQNSGYTTENPASKTEATTGSGEWFGFVWIGSMQYRIKASNFKKYLTKTNQRFSCFFLSLCLRPLLLCNNCNVIIDSAGNFISMQLIYGAKQIEV